MNKALYAALAAVGFQTIEGQELTLQKLLRADELGDALQGEPTNLDSGETTMMSVTVATHNVTVRDVLGDYSAKHHVNSNEGISILVAAGLNSAEIPNLRHPSVGMGVNLSGVVRATQNAAEELELKARDLRRLAEKLEETGNPDLIEDIVRAITGGTTLSDCLAKITLRSLTEYDRALTKANGY